MSVRKRSNIARVEVSEQTVKATDFRLPQEYEPRSGDTRNHSDETHILYFTISLSKMA